jgi:hypothetical protein
MKRFIAFILIAGISTFSASCNQNPPTAAPKLDSAPKTTIPAAAPAGPVKLTGKVLETMDSGGYTYVLLENNNQKTWLAIPLSTITVGETMSFNPGSEMIDFTSKTLNRTFERIIFSPGLASAKADDTTAPAHATSSAAPVADPGEESIPPKAPGSSGASVAPVEKIEVARAMGSNAFTVAEIFQKGTELDKQKIVVRGKVVKVTPQVMKKNWIHLQDGTGSADTRSHDLVVTTTEMATVGDLVLVEGTVGCNRDFGFGYSYNLLIEDARLQKNK